MQIRAVEKNQKICAVVSGKGKAIKGVGSALDVLMSAKYEAKTENVVIDKRLVADGFFSLARAFPEKFCRNTSIMTTIPNYTSKPLKDFIYESNKGKNVFFTSTEEAIDILTR